MRNTLFNRTLSVAVILKFRFFCGTATLLLFSLLINRNLSAYNQTSQSMIDNTQSPPYTQQPAGAAPKAVTGSVTSTTNNSTVLHGVVNANGLETTVWFQYRVINGLSTNTFSTQKVIGINDTDVNIRVIRLLPGTTYYYRIVAKNDAGITYGDEFSFTTVDIKPYFTTDVTSPVGLISINNGAHFTNTSTITLNLSATDNIGVMGYYISSDLMVPSAMAPGWVSLPPFAAYTEKFTENVPYTLGNEEGLNTVYVWYKDFAGNVSSTASTSIILDATPPSISITSPTSDTIYATTDNTISISGIAADKVSGVNSLLWVNSREEGTTENKMIHWVIPEIRLFEGDNTITIKVTDGAGNTREKMITVTCSPDIAAVVITGSVASLAPYSATLYGVVNPKGLSTTIWFEYGMVSGSYHERSSIQNIGDSTNDISVRNRISGLLAGTTYYYRLAAQNNAGTVYGNEMSFNTPAPKGKIYGKVVYATGGKPIRYAKLKLKGRYAKKRAFKTIYSDANGSFIFKNLDADTYDISVEKIGVKSATQTISLNEGKEKNIRIELKARRERE